MKIYEILSIYYTDVEMQLCIIHRSCVAICTKKSLKILLKSTMKKLAILRGVWYYN